MTWLEPDDESAGDHRRHSKLVFPECDAAVSHLESSFHTKSNPPAAGAALHVLEAGAGVAGDAVFDQRAVTDQLTQPPGAAADEIRGPAARRQRPQRRAGDGETVERLGDLDVR